MSDQKIALPKPPWLRRRLPAASALARVEQGLRHRGLHTICEQGQCPNQGECFARGVATLLIMGERCTRSCRFCAVAKGRPRPLDPAEPKSVADQVRELGLSFVVITSVTRDDLIDGGAAHFGVVTQAIREACPGVGIELLVPDFQGSKASLDTVLQAAPQVLAHNLETVPRLYGAVRPQADYRRSLELLERCARSGRVRVKSGIMLGLGEKVWEVEVVLSDLLRAGCSMLTMGQYLAPSQQHHAVKEYVRPEHFKELGRMALAMGFKAVSSGTFVRSSYLAEDLYYNGTAPTYTKPNPS